MRHALVRRILSFGVSIPGLMASLSRSPQRLEPLSTANAERLVALRRLSRPVESRRPAQCVVAYTPDGSRLVGSALSRDVRVFAPRSGRLRRTIETGDAIAMGIAISPDGKTLAIAAAKLVLLVELDTGKPIGSLEEQGAVLRELAFSPDGMTLASGADDGSVWLWNLAERQSAARLEKGRGYVLSLDFSPDGNVLAEGNADGFVRLRDGHTGAVLRSLEIGEPVGDLAFSPDGRILASASDDNLIRLWDPSTGRLSRTLEGHSGYVNGLAFSPDGKLLASGSHDGKLGLWDPETCRLLRLFEGHRDVVLRLAFRPDGRQLASISRDGSIILWAVPRSTPR